jgi:hypothetical protein
MRSSDAPWLGEKAHSKQNKLVLFCGDGWANLVAQGVFMYAWLCTQLCTLRHMLRRTCSRRTGVTHRCRK